MDVLAFVGDTTAGAGAGAGVGTAINPGAGTVIGSIVGGISGALKNILGEKPGKTTAGNDKSYVSAVQQEVNSEYDQAARALAIINPLDKDTANFIQNAYKTELAKWGDLNNPNRDVADPIGFSKIMSDIINNYKYNPINFSAQTGENSQAFDSSQNNVLTQKIYDSKGNIIGEVTQKEEQTAVNYTPMILIGGAILLGALLLLRR